MANMRDATGVGALQYEGAKAAYYSSSRYIQFNGLQGQRATKLVKFWRLVTDGDTSLQPFRKWLKNMARAFWVPIFFTKIVYDGWYACIW
jgi:hypothetical protein